MSGQLALEARFDATRPRPPGRYAVEASAGTGKTYALSTLAVSYVVEHGVKIDEVLVVTFTRAAATELRDRVRSRLAEASTALESVVRGADAPTGDEFLAHLCATDQPVRRDRARAALAAYDTASVMTIHGFAQQVLGALGSSAGGDPDAVLGDDGGALLRESCIDVLVGESLRSGGETIELPSRDELFSAAAVVSSNHDIEVVPGPEPADSNEAAALRRRMVDEALARTASRRRAAATLSFDDLLVRLRDALIHSERGEATRAVLAHRFRVALIDEFQDTDPVQWEIFSSVFGGEGTDTSLIVVGDPKQAIYGFRGADVHTYLDAIHEAGIERETLAVNWRSDGALLDGLEALLDGVTFGDPRIGFPHVDAAPGHSGSRLRDASGAPLPAVELRLALGGNLVRQARRPHHIGAADAARAVYADLADHVRSLLETGRIPSGEHDEARPLRPGDVAVLVVARNESTRVRDALARAGVPAVIASGDNVLEAPAVDQWRWLLEAIARPADPGRARMACLTWFFGWSATRLAEADDDEVAGVQEQLHRWGEVLAASGTTDFFRTIRAQSGVVARLVSSPDGERSVTDLDHLAELVTAAAPEGVGASGLLAVFDGLTDPVVVAEADLEVAARRVQSEADAVQIMTVHAAKGLEFPVVCCPSLYRSTPARASAVVFHDPVTARRAVDVAPKQKWPDKTAAEERATLAEAEAVGQNLRLLYVALTRARHHVALWWSRCQGSEITGLARVLFARAEGAIDPTAFDARKVSLPDDEVALDAFEAVLAANPDTIRARIVDAPVGEPRRWAGGVVTPDEPLAVASLGRTLDRLRRRWSFSAMTAAEHVPDPLDHSLGDAAAGDETGEAGAQGDAALPEDSAATLAASPRIDPVMEADDAVSEGSAHGLPLGSIAGGRRLGNLVHRALEHTDFAAADLSAEVGGHVAEAAAWEGVDVDLDLLSAGLCAAIRTPLGPVFAGRALREVSRADRLDEMEFEITLAERGATADVSAIGALILDHLGADDPLRDWAARLVRRDGAVKLAGHMVGYVDSVIRVREPAQADRFVVVDYKTNTLGAKGSPPSLDDYHPRRLPDAMAHHDYPLQALIYSVALHRYLRWRLPDYRPTIHLGGIAYLFVRGMVGPDTPLVDGVPHGVFSWRPDSELVAALSDLIDGQKVGR